jgi:hypothetical protein
MALEEITILPQTTEVYTLTTTRLLKASLLAHNYMLVMVKTAPDKTFSQSYVEKLLIIPQMVLDEMGISPALMVAFIQEKVLLRIY